MPSAGFLFSLAGIYVLLHISVSYNSSHAATCFTPRRFLSTLSRMTSFSHDRFVTSCFFVSTSFFTSALSLFQCPLLFRRGRSGTANAGSLLTTTPPHPSSSLPDPRDAASTTPTPRQAPAQSPTFLSLTPPPVPPSLVQGAPHFLVVSSTTRYLIPCMSYVRTYPSYGPPHLSLLL